MWTDSGGFVHTASGIFRGPRAVPRTGTEKSARRAPVGKTAAVPIQKITGPEGSEVTGFVIVDLDGADAADGVVRCAKKILMDGARTMARSRTYSWALLGERRSGAAAAINAAPPDREVGITTFVDAVRDRVDAGALSLDAGKGVGQPELAALQEVDRRSPLRAEVRAHGSLADELTATSAVAAAAATLGGLEGRTVVVEGAGSLEPALVHALGAAGARIVAGGAEAAAAEVLATPADAVFCGSKLGLVDHAVAAALSTQVLVPVGVAPVTAKGLAVAARAGVVVLADFLTLSGGLASMVAPADATADSLVESVRERTTELTVAAAAHDDGAYLGACDLAEQFLSSWVDELPFGRPLA